VNTRHPGAVDRSILLGQITVFSAPWVCRESHKGGTQENCTRFADIELDHTKPWRSLVESRRLTGITIRHTYWSGKRLPCATIRFDKN